MVGFRNVLFAQGKSIEAVVRPFLIPFPFPRVGCRRVHMLSDLGEHVSRKSETFDDKY